MFIRKWIEWTEVEQNGPKWIEWTKLDRAGGNGLDVPEWTKLEEIDQNEPKYYFDEAQ